MGSPKLLDEFPYIPHIASLFRRTALRRAAQGIILAPLCLTPGLVGASEEESDSAEEEEEEEEEESSFQLGGAFRYNLLYTYYEGSSAPLGTEGRNEASWDMWRIEALGHLGQLDYSFQYRFYPTFNTHIHSSWMAGMERHRSDAPPGSLVVDMIAAGGETNTWPAQRVFWCVLEGLVASILLFTGGRAALQTATIAGALPFTMVMLLLCWGLYRGMSADLSSQKSAAGVRFATPGVGLTWQRRLSRLLSTPTEEDVDNFIEDFVVAALTEVAEAFVAKGYPAEFLTDQETEEENTIRLVVPAEDVRDFVYGVQHISRPLPTFMVTGLAQDEQRHEARTFFSDGSQGYDVMGMSESEIITDVLIQFERYQALVQSPKSALFIRAPERR